MKYYIKYLLQIKYCDNNNYQVITKFKIILKIDDNYCTHLVCLNFGTCVNKEGAYYCRCHRQYTGNRCQTGMMYLTNLKQSILYVVIYIYIYI